MALATPQSIVPMQKLKEGTSTSFHNGLFDVVSTQEAANDGLIQALPNHNCEQVTISNDTGATIKVFRINVDKVNYVQILTGTRQTFQGLGGSSANLGVVRADANGQKASVTLQLDINW